MEQGNGSNYDSLPLSWLGLQRIILNSTCPAHHVVLALHVALSAVVKMHRYVER